MFRILTSDRKITNKEKHRAHLKIILLHNQNRKPQTRAHKKTRALSTNGMVVKKTTNVVNYDRYTHLLAKMDLTIS